MSKYSMNDRIQQHSYITRSPDTYDVHANICLPFLAFCCVCLASCVLVNSSISCLYLSLSAFALFLYASFCSGVSLAHSSFTFSGVQLSCSSLKNANGGLAGSGLE
eukprot:TRINITY_DN5995_c0_g1_i2.p1 TRINITY_DN5995_c0_g1~~TRINITY_DN5995_c0_g1_i2.p1  ORF type:complete len:106 (+),score=10.26 TRINITY_DN5995_c0_g1_i2:158-475(+)